VGAEKYWYSNSFSGEKQENSSVFLLPAYDEFLISYQDKSAALMLMGKKEIISINGIFRPSILIKNQVCGLWKKVMKKDVVFVEVQLLQPVHESTESLIAEKVEQFGSFLGLKTSCIFSKNMTIK